jgi:hypothetical protein
MVPTADATALRRARELDALDVILPYDRRDQLATLLADDVATLKHVAGAVKDENMTNSSQERSSFPSNVLIAGGEAFCIVGWINSNAQHAV